MSGIDTPMNFELLRDSLEALLLTYATGRFRVVTEQKQSTDSEQNKDLNRSIQIFYETGDFPDGNSSKQEFTHETTFTIEYSASSTAKGDLSEINNPLSTDADYMTAMAAAKPASRLANKSIDELRRMVFQIFMDTVNINNGLGLGRTDTGGAKINNTVKLTNYRKNQPIAKGHIFELSATENLMVGVLENPPGATPIAPDPETYNIEHKFNNEEDPTETVETVVDAT